MVEIALYSYIYDREVKKHGDNHYEKWICSSGLENRLQSQLGYGDLGIDIFLLNDTDENGMYKAFIEALLGNRNKEIEEDFLEDSRIHYGKIRKTMLVAVHSNMVLKLLKQVVVPTFMTFGKYRGKKASEVIEENPSYFKMDGKAGNDKL